MAERARAPKNGGDTKDEIEKLAKGKRKAAKAKKPGPGHNGEVPDEVIDRHLEAVNIKRLAMDKAKAEFDQKKGEFRAALKLAKEDGVNIDALRWAHDLSKQDTAEVLQRVHDTGRILKRMNVPLGFQFGLFSDVEAPKLVNPVLAGQAAGKSGAPRTDNPHPPGSDDFQLWDDAWLAEQTKIAQAMAQDAGAPAP